MRIKKSPQPPDWLITRVWTVVYGKAPGSLDRSRALAWWALQLALSGMWPVVFFRKRKKALLLLEAATLAANLILYFAKEGKEKEA
jgi:tryptophan-rich sensory protein